MRKTNLSLAALLIVHPFFIIRGAGVQASEKASLPSEAATEAESDDEIIASFLDKVRESALEKYYAELKAKEKSIAEEAQNTANFHRKASSQRSLSLLPKASERVPGEFLTPPQFASIFTDKTFNVAMGKQAELVAIQFLEHPEIKDLQDLKLRLAEIAKVRAQFGGNGGSNYGKWTIENYDELCEGLEEDIADFKRYPPEMKCGLVEMYSTGHGVLSDFIRSNENYKSIFEKGKILSGDFPQQTVDSSWAGVTLTLDPAKGQEKVALSTIRHMNEAERNKFQTSDGLKLSHISYERQIAVRNFAYMRLIEAINQSDLDGLAESYRLLCHATPWVNGTPAVLETFIDGFLRSKGFALPSKKDEPFWNAIMHRDSDGPFTWERFIENFHQR